MTADGNAIGASLRVDSTRDALLNPHGDSMLNYLTSCSRIAWPLLIVCGLALLVAGCGSKNEPTAAGTGTPEDVGASGTDTIQAPSQGTVLGSDESVVSTDLMSEEIDLIRLFDRQHDVMQGQIRRNNGLLQTNSTRVASLIRLPVTPPDDYDLEMTLTRKQGGGSLYFAVMIEGVKAMLVVDAKPDQGSFTGISLFDQRGPADPKYQTTRVKGVQLPVGQKQTLRCEVRGRSLRLYRGRELVYSWEGDPARLSLAPFFRKVKDDALFIGNSNSDIDYHSFTLRHALSHQPQRLASGPAAQNQASPSEPSSVAETEKWINDKRAWFFVPRGSEHTLNRYENELATNFVDAQRLLFEVRRPLSPLQLINTARFSGDFQMKLRVGLPSRSDPDVIQPGGTALPYFGVRASEEANLDRHIHMPPLKIDPQTIDLSVSRQGGEYTFSVDGREARSYGRLGAETCQVFVHMNAPAKIWIEGFQIEGDYVTEMTGTTSPRPLPADPTVPALALGKWQTRIIEDDRRRFQAQENIKLSETAKGLRIDVSEKAPNEILYFGDNIEGDFRGRIRIILPAENDVPASRKKPRITLAGTPASAPASHLRRRLPDLDRQEQEVLLEVQRIDGAISTRINGSLQSGTVDCKPPVRLGILVEGDVHCWIAEAEIEALAAPTQPEMDESKLVGDPLREFDLPGAVTSTALGGQGRYWSLFMPSLSQVAIFDLASQEIIGYIALDEPHDFMTADATHLYVGSNESKSIKSWRLSDQQSVATAKWTGDDRLKALSAGHASQGPILAVFRSPIEGNQLRFLDALELTAVPVSSTGDRPSTLDESNYVRASADGRRFGVSLRPAQLIRLEGRRAEIATAATAKVVLPGPAGKHVFSDVELLNDQLNVSRPNNQSISGTVIPTTIPSYYLSVHTPSSWTTGDPTLHRVSLHRVSDLYPLGVFSDLRVPGRLGLISKKRPDLTLDQRIVCNPLLGIAVALDASNDRMLIKSFKFKDLLAQRKEPYLSVTSLPVVDVQPGETLRFTPAIVSSAPATIRLQSGPDGLSVNEQGELSWAVPRATSGQRKTAILQIESGDAQTLTYPLTINVAASTSDQIALDSSLAKPKPKPPEPLEILEPEHLEIMLPSDIAKTTVGGNGQVLVLHLPKLKQLALLDLEQQKITRYIDVNEEKIQIAAGRDRVVALLPTKRRIKTWSLSTGELLREANLPGDDTPVFVAMGMESADSIVVGIEQPEGIGLPMILDANTLRPRRTRLEGNLGFRFTAGTHVHASADGSQLFAWQTDGNPSGFQSLLLTGQRLQASYSPASAGYLAPSPAGRFIYTPIGIFSADGKPTFDHVGRENKSVFMPTTLDGMHLRVHKESRLYPRDKSETQIDVHLDGNETPFLKLPKVNLRPANYSDNFAREPFTFEQRVHCDPRIGRVATIPTSNDRVVIYSVNVSEALKVAAQDHLMITSRPSTEFIEGETYAYDLQTMTNLENIDFEIQSGPPEMTIDDEGRIRWESPIDDSEESYGIIISVRSGETQTFQSFRLQRVETDSELNDAEAGNELQLTPRAEPASSQTAEGGSVIEQENEESDQDRE